MKSFLKYALINAVAIKLASMIVPGVRIYSPWGLILATLFLTALNEFVRPIMVIFALPLLIFTLGLFYLVINTLLLELVGHLTFLQAHFSVDNFAAAFWGSLIISFVSLVLRALTKTGNASIQFHRGGPPPPPPPKDDGGPVIDV